MAIVRPLYHKVIRFALASLLLFVTISIVIEGGRMLTFRQELATASREGALVAARNGATAGDVAARVTKCLAHLPVQDATITVNPANPSAAPGGTHVSVTVQIPLRELTWLPPQIFPAGSQLKASTIVRRDN